MSVRILESWHKEALFHTPLDDFESFIWVLLWGVLQILAACGKLNSEERGWVSTLASGNLRTVLYLKSYLTTQFMAHETSFDFSKGMEPFLKCFGTLFDLATRARKAVTACLQEDQSTLAEITKQYAQLYAEGLIGAIAHLPPSWD